MNEKTTLVFAFKPRSGGHTVLRFWSRQEAIAAARQMRRDEGYHADVVVPPTYDLRYGQVILCCKPFKKASTS